MKAKNLFSAIFCAFSIGAASAQALLIPQAEQGARCANVAATVIGQTYGPTVVEKVKLEGLTLRVTARDKERYPVTMDYQPNRVNVGIEDGVIVSARCG